MPAKTSVNIFFAYANELKAEREKTLALLGELKKRYPSLHLKHQLASEQETHHAFINTSDIVVALIYSHIGMFKQEALERFIAQGKEVLLYIKTGFHSTDPNTLIEYLETARFRKAIDFQGKINYQEFDTPESYAHILNNDLSRYLAQHVQTPLARDSALQRDKKPDINPKINMPSEPTLASLRMQLATGNTKEVLEALMKRDAGSSNILIMLMARINRLEKEAMMGLIANNEANIERNRINNAVLSIMDELEK